MTGLTLFHANRQIDTQRSLSARLERLQGQVTGPRLTAASDAPRDWAGIAVLDRQGTRLDAHGAALAAGRSDAGAADAVLGRIGDALARARELVIARGGPAADGAFLADAIAGVREEIAALMATTMADGRGMFPEGHITRAVPSAPGQMLPTAPAAAAVAGVPRADGTVASLDKMLVDMEAAVRGGDGIDEALSMATEAITHFATIHGRHGLAMARLDRAIEANGVQRLATSVDRSRLADTDVAEAIALIQSQLVTLDAARATMVRMSERNLLDLLR